MKQSDWYSPGDEEAPFFSQAVIYPLLEWKDNGRSLFALLHGWMAAAGFDPYAIKMLASKAKRSQDLQSAVTSGGLARVSEMDQVDWLPEEGWTAGLTAQGVGIVTAQVAKVVANDRPGGPRAAWDVRVHFTGGSYCHFSRLLRIAHWIKNTDGEKVWPPPEKEVTNG